MKYVLLIVAVLVIVLFVASQLWANAQVDDIEEYAYEVEQSVGDVEIRNYAEANFIYATMDAGTYDEASSNGFRILAGYIFGGNESQQKIAMTSPVEMEMKDSITMKFLIPAQYEIEELPEPDNIEVKFMSEKSRRMAAITFGGFADDAIIESQREALFDQLAEAGITHSGNWSFMGYDPPFKVVDRKNEVVVELD